MTQLERMFERMSDPVVVMPDDAGRPSMLTWRGGKYRVTEAIRLSDLFQPTHPLPFDGYRVSVINEHGWHYRLDLRLDARSSTWALIGVSSRAD